MRDDDVQPDRESIADDLGVWSIDDETQLQPEDTLVDRGVDDVLDEGYSPPDSPRGSYAHGTTAHEQRLHETIDERLPQEEPDPYAHPASAAGPGRDADRLGGSDPDAIDADDDYLGQAGSRRCGRLVAPDEGAHPDTEGQAYAGDVGIDGGAASAEEAAMHIVEDR